MNTYISVVCYINGVRFHPASVQYTAQADGFGNFAIELPAVADWMRLPERSHCAVFYTDPVSLTWRLLCEGEYTGLSRSKTAEGQRHLVLTFEPLQAIWRHLPFANIIEMVNSGPEAILAANASGLRIPDLGSGGPPTAINAIVDEAIRSAKSTSLDFTAVLVALIEAMLKQVPIEQFYADSFKVLRKVDALPDKEIGSIFDAQRWEDMIKNGFNALGIGATTSMFDIISAYAAFAMYRITMIPAPPLSRDGTGAQPGGGVDHSTHRLREMLFIPYLYHVIPPRCNVLFSDQISTIQMSRQFRLEPTRVFGQLELPGEARVPAFFMDNGIRDEAGGLLALQTDPPESLPELLYRKYSHLEYRRGIIAQTIPIRMTKIFGTQAEGAALDAYVDAAVRHHFQVAKARNRVVSVTATFQPYLAPGFPIAIEDESGPIYGMLDEVTHQLAPGSPPSTTLRISHVRDLRVVTGQDDPDPTPLLPAWLNAKFRPGNVSDTYRSLLGCPAAGSGGVTQGLTGEANVELGRVLQTLFPVPQYPAGGASSWSSNTAAEHFRASIETARQQLTYQHRPGVNLLSYAQWHGLATQTGMENAFETPPAGLAPEANRMFAIPTKTNEDTKTVVADGSSDFRQVVARSLQALIERGIAED